MATFTKRGDRWRAQVRRLGHTTASATFATKAEAQAWARSTEHKADRGHGTDTGRRVTFAALCKAYRENVGLARGMSRSKEQALGHIEELLGPRRLPELKDAAFIAFCRTREKEGAGPATILMDLSYIGTVLRHGAALVGAREAVIPAVAALEAARMTLRHAGRVARPEERDRRPTETEVASLLDHWAANPRQAIPMADLVLFAIATAMRLGEITRLEWSDLDEKARTILIRSRKHPTKKVSNHQRVPLLDVCRFEGRPIDPLAIVLRQPSARLRQGRIFPHAAASVSTAFTRAVAAVEIPDLHFHDLRHDGASRLFEAGYPIEQVALVTGHKDWNMLRRYTQIRAEHLHRAPVAAPEPAAPIPPRPDNVVALPVRSVA